MSPDITDEMVSAFALGAHMGDPMQPGATAILEGARASTIKRIREGLAFAIATPAPERKPFEVLLATAMEAVEALNDWASVNETEFTGWGDGDVPPIAEFWRVKSGQARKALQELRKP